MNPFEETIRDIEFFGAKITLDHIEKIKYFKRRKIQRILFEIAFGYLRTTNYSYYNMDYPITEKQENVNLNKIKDRIL